MATRKQFSTFCRMCFGRCSLLVTVEDGKLVEVAPDPKAPPTSHSPCAKGLALPHILNHPNRLKYPMKRQGARGAGEWSQISWTEAMDTIAGALDSLRQQSGPESVGICLGDPKGLELAFAQRFASAFGTPNIATPGHICHMPGELGCTHTFGSSCHCDPDHQPRCIVVWGNNLTHTRNGMSPGHVNGSLSQGARLIVIDPRKTDLARRADVWIRPRPGSDSALVMGLIKVILEERLYDDAFVKQWTVGFEQLEEQVATFSLDQVEKATWVPADMIRQAARLYATTRPGTIEGGNALDHGTNSIQTWRAVCILRAISGNLDVPGGELLVTPPDMVRPGRFMLLKDFPRKTASMAGSRFKLAARSAFIPRQSLIKAILEETPCQVKAALLFGTNPLLTFPNARETYQALMKLEFLAVADLFMTPTAAIADVVLPVAFNCEFDEIAPYPSPSGTVHAYPKIVDPPGECRPDMRIINELAAQLGLQEQFWSQESEALDFILGPAGMTFDDLRSRRTLEGERSYRKHEAKGFRTPSGKVEIYSEPLKEMGYSPLPNWAEMSSNGSEPVGLSTDYPLLLTSAKERTFCHSAHRSIGTLRLASPEPVVEMSPEAARNAGLGDGERVCIETEWGSIEQRLRLNADLDPRVAVASFGWWFPEGDASDAYGWSRSNINVLTSNSPPYDPAVGSLPLRGIPCKVYRAESDI